MADDYTVLNPGEGGDVMDESLVVYPSAPNNRKRPRIVITGEGIDDIVPAQSTNVNGNEFGLITRPVISNYPGNEQNTFDYVTLVAASIETTITSYTVPTDETFYFIGFNVSGNSNAIFKLYVAGNVVLASRTSVANLTLSMQYSYSPIKVNEGDTIEIKVTHNRINFECDFEATILGYTL